MQGLLDWLNRWFLGREAAPPQVEASPITDRLDTEATLITEAHDTSCQVFIVAGLHDLVREVREAHTGVWLGEVGYSRVTGKFYRVQREDL